MGTIPNGANTPLNAQAGTVPNLSGALLDYFQPMVFTRVTKTVGAFQAIESAEEINFRGVIQPLTDRALQLKPEGQRAWTWLMLHAQPVLTLDVDEVVNYLGVQTRVMARKDYTLYGYVQYELVQDWTGSGPYPGATPPSSDLDGGAPDTDFTSGVDGGDVEE